MAGAVHHFRYVWYEFSKYTEGTVFWIPGPPCRVWLVPINIPVTMSIDRIGFVFRNVFGNIITGIYADNGDQPDGGALIIQSASLPMGAIFSKNEFAVALTQLTQGEYWIAVEGNNVAGQFHRGFNNMAAGGTLFGRSFNLAGGYGVLPDPCPVTVAENNSPISFLRVASVP